VILPIRVRLTGAYVLTAAVLTGVGAYVFSTSVQLGVEHQLDQRIRSHAVRLARIVQREGPNGVHLQTPVDADLLTEIVAPDGRVAAESPALAGTTLLRSDELAAFRANGGFRTVGSGPDYRLYAAPALRSDGTWLVVTTTPLQAQTALAETVTSRLLIAATAVVVIGGFGAWFLSGAALRPIERLRREVAKISKTDPASEVRVPDTGDEIARLAETMNSLLAGMAEALARQRQFVADASHEVRTPLANLRISLELASMPGRTREQLREAVQYGEQEAIRLGSLVNNLLLLAAADDHVPVDRLPNQLVLTLLESAAVAVRPTAAAKAVTVSVEADPGLTATLHPGLIRQVLDNLLSNAIRYAPHGSVVSIRAAVRDGALSVEVTDLGPGFPEGFAEHAFERFRRGDPGRSRSAGSSGLGLAVVRAIARAHGGDVAAENRACGGAAVRISVPLARNPE
jgi:signal transduction histidine kinase